MSKASVPPVAERRPHEVTHHGITLTDPYAWLQDPGYPSVTDENILSYLNDENAYFEDQMSAHQTQIERLFDEFKKRQKLDDESVPYCEHGYFHQWVFHKDAQYPVWRRWQVSDPESKQTILDEPALAADRDYFRLGGFDISPNGRYIAWSSDTDGSERFNLTLKDLESGVLLDDEIACTIGSPIWAQDNKTLFYVLVNDNWRPFQVKAHVLGEPVDADRIIYTEADEAFFVGISITQSEKYLTIVAHGCG